jgi:hypothetical protein
MVGAARCAVSRRVQRRNILPDAQVAGEAVPPALRAGTSQRDVPTQLLARIFHTPMEMPTDRRVRARGLQAAMPQFVGRVPHAALGGVKYPGQEKDFVKGPGHFCGLQNQVVSSSRSCVTKVSHNYGGYRSS